MKVAITDKKLQVLCRTEFNACVLPHSLNTMFSVITAKGCVI